MKLVHVALWTHDLDCAADFWHTYFHAEVGEPYRSQRRAGFTSRFVTLPNCSVRIELMAMPTVADAPAVNHVGWDHIAISLGNNAKVDQLAARCQEYGLLLSEPRMTVSLIGLERRAIGLLRSSHL